MGCKVFTDPNLGGIILSDEEDAYMQWAFANFDDVSDIANLRKKAEDAGRSKAAEPGGCDYWHKHPDQVYRLRKAAGDNYGLQ
jgi:hypothetical protein